ncbi:phosphoribosyltransferase [Iodidimonas muriae]|uniref:Phosphoribosyltransferase n=1 Tax=Iodidimonas muriae TaxID=261467 RepID=A0ABQ2LAN3_9PROT|nr:ComF family protein [Iodidimonas muriae]GER06244.1 phosphoribosyltransferase [Kordiimonadales bacterium JCM 17843]GGO08790.1 phosphoribosyltransferase [Iodidimonas muriae]
MKRWLGVALDSLLPPRCYACGTLVDRQGALCGPCWSGLHFITAPSCMRCGYPFEIGLDGHHMCGACLAHPPAYDRGISALVYDDASRALILGFKRADRLELAKPLAGLMAQAGRDLLAQADLIVPVPLHRTRLLSRRFNQSAVLARALAQISGTSWTPFLLERTRRTPSQGGLNRAERTRNVRGAFRIRPKAQATHVLRNTHILLVDDVLTTGATVTACTGVLRKAGASSISVLTLARVVTPGQGPI